ncbi:MAG: [Fe-Fe] hydrogenase large subunit C-terminal domain-containing protein [Bacillota bacterium]
MGIIQSIEANCKNCYNCIRHCPVKAIKFQNEQATVLEDECVLCGSCYLACQQKAKQIQSDLDTIKGFIENRQKVYASIAPSFVSAFPQVSFAQISHAIKRLGFTSVEETAIGAAKVSAQYGHLIREGHMQNIITTCCPTIVLLVEKYYPELIKYLSPVISPALAHARMMKNVYGSRIKTVFIGPCFSKKHEAQRSGDINATLLFDELRDWLHEAGIEPDEADPKPSEIRSVINRLYPVPGGVIRTIPSALRKTYKCVAVDGLDKCMEVLESLYDDKLTGFFIEMSACAGSCIGGPALHTFDTPKLSANNMIIHSAKAKTQTPAPMSENSTVDMHAQYFTQRITNKVPDEATIKAILASIGKISEDKMYNCGACGYKTCREKAIAVFQGKADVKMCMPYMRERAESMSNMILDHTPNAIFVLDGEFKIIEFNTAAIKVFHLNDMNYIGMPLGRLLPNDCLDKVKATGSDILDHKIHLGQHDRTLEVSILHIEDNDAYIVIAKDITSEEKQHEELARMRAETLEVAQNVIDKQMRVAQEIASLLGETTGETKAALTKLKKTIVQGDLE